MAKYETTNKLRSNILKGLFSIFILLALSLMYIIYLEQNKILDNFVDTTHNSLEKTVDYAFSDVTETYTTLAHRLVKHSKIIGYVVRDDREGLYEALRDKFKDFSNETPYFKTMHFIKADGTSFLRVHKPDKYGDPIMNDRLMVQEIMKNKKTLVGYETGKYATVFRLMIPVFHEGEFLGSLGLGIDPNLIQEKIAKIVKTKGALFIKEEKLKLYKLESKYDFTLSGFRLHTKLDEKTQEVFQNLPEKFKLKDDYLFKYNNMQYLLHSVDIKNFQNEIHGKFVFIQDITKKINNLKNTQIIIGMTILVFLLIAFIIIRYFIIKFGNNIDIFYDKTISKIQKNEKYLQAIEDNSSNIIVTSKPNEKMVDANKRFFEFTGFNSIEEFKNKYECICDLFIKREGYLQKEVEGERWVKYIVKNPDSTHKAIIKKDNEERIFKVNTSQVLLDGELVYISTFVDITEIEEIRSRLSYAINGTKDGLWDWDLQTDEVYFSPRWKSMLGYEPDEIPSSLTTWEERVHPDDKEQALKDIEDNHKKLTDTYENIHRLRHKNGHWVYILDRGQTIFDENGKAVRMVGFHTDITQRKQEEKLIQLQAKRAEALLKLPKFSETLSEKEFVQKGQEIAEDLTQSKIAFIHFVNDDQKTIELVAWSNRTLKEYCHVDSYETHYPVKEAGIWANSLRTHKAFVVNDYPNYAYKEGLPEGHAHLQRFVSVPVVENGKVVMITGVGNKKEDYDETDVETVQLISNDIWQSVQRNRSKNELEQKDKLMLTQSRNAAMGEMISMIAHQWRQPLAVISMSANNTLADVELDMLEEKNLRLNCAEIIDQTKELSRTIDDFKEFFKPVKKSEEVFIKDIFASTFNVVGKSLDYHNIHVTKEINSDTQIQTYSRELMQVFINIINNAKEVLIEQNVENRQLTIEVQELEKYLLINICDNGGGIEDEIMDRIFEPYFSTKDERTGTGLGLYMSKIIIEKHLGGLLKVENKEDGACFTIELPYKLNENNKQEDTDA